MASLLANILKTQHKAIFSARFFSRNVIRFEKTAPAVAPQAISDDGSKLSGKTHRVNNLEKRLLVWTGKYKSVDEVPAWVSPESVEKARNKTRIRLANIMMIATAFACLVMVISGKKAAGRGESVQKANIEWHKRVNEEDAKHQK